MNLKSFAFLLSMLSLSPAFSQAEEGFRLFQKSDKKFDSYRNLSSGFSIITFRDFATSPLFYIGGGINLTSGWQKNAVNSEHLTEMSIQFGGTIAMTPQSDFFQIVSPATFTSFDLYRHDLYSIKKVSIKDSDLKLGSTVLATSNIRVNPNLNNNSAGFESFINLMFAAKLSTDISRKEAKTVDFLLFKKTYNPIKRKLDFQLNTGILNFNYRPGYAYSDLGEIDGTNTSILGLINEGYTWTLNGYRLGTRFEYTRYRPSGNAVKWAYLWDVLNAPGKHETFQMATHRIQYTIQINRN